MFKQRVYKFIAALLVVILALPVLTAEAAGKQPTEQEFANKIAALRMEFPALKYWTNANGKVTTGRYKGSSKVGSAGCNDVGSLCGTFAVEGREMGWECRGYVLLMADKVFGCCIHNDDGQWNYRSYSKGSFGGAYYAGDLVKLKMNSGREHWIFVYKITSDKIYYTDCNRIGKCRIDWKEDTLYSVRSRTIGLERYQGNTLKGTGTVAHTLTIRYNANGGSIPGSEKKEYRYKVTVDVGVNLRKTPAANGEKVSTIPQGALFTVDETKKADGYTWGKTTYDGKTGWCVISEDWTVKTLLPVTTYYLSSTGQIYKSANAGIYQQKMTQGKTYDNGLVNASSFGLKRAGYTFRGWSLKTSGGTVIDQNAALKPESILPALKNGDQTITLYAIWQADPTALTNLPYKDVGANDWFLEGVKFVHEQQLMNGTTANTFSPYDSTTRAMLVTILYRLEGKPAIQEEVSFTDVSAGQWYSEAVAWAAANKIVEGNGMGQFYPEQSITRQQMATILYRYAQSKGAAEATEVDLTEYIDVESVAPWATEGMSWAVGAELISGGSSAEGKILQPEGEAARAQIATVLMRYVQKMK